MYLLEFTTIPSVLSSCTFIVSTLQHDDRLPDLDAIALAYTHPRHTGTSGHGF